MYINLYMYTNINSNSFCFILQDYKMELRQYLVCIYLLVSLPSICFVFSQVSDSCHVS